MATDNTIRLGDIYRQAQQYRMGQQQEQQQAGANTAQAARMFTAAFGQPVKGETPDALQARWGQAKSILESNGIRINNLSDTFNQAQFDRIQGIASSGIGNQQDTIQSTWVNDQGDRIGLYRSGKTMNLGKSERTAEEEIEYQRRLAREKQAGKGEAEIEQQPKLVALTEQAKANAKRAAEKGSDLDAFEANMPALEEVVGELRELSKVATYSTSGRIFDATVRELGFGATEGGTARAKYIAIVNNQVLPLLKATLGAAFTDSERLALQATLGDVNLSPEEKQAQLDAFIESKRREQMTKRAQAGIQADNSQDNDPLGIR